MLAFDIETTGLEGSKHDVTVVCTEDYHTGERIAYEFDRVRKCEPQNLSKLREDLVAALTAATSLCAFNGIRFDIPFLRKSLALSHDVTNEWIWKTTDILEACRLGKFGPKHTFGLNLLCQHNGIQMKTSSGKEAITMAANNRWDDLKNYCTEDVRILCDLYRKKVLQNPRGHMSIDLAQIAHPDLYVNTAQTADRLTEHSALTIHTSLPAQVDPIFEHSVVNSCEDPIEAHQALYLSLNTQIAKLKTENAELKQKLQVYNDFCTCI
jgi:hypothetical protein